MSTQQRAGHVTSSEYMHWAKTAHARARFNLANSGMRAYPLARLPVALADLELSGPSFYGYAPLQEAVARKEGVTADCVVAARGGQRPLPADAAGVPPRRSVSSWMDAATSRSRSPCSRAWWAQNRSSPPETSSTRKYAWAPQRSQRSAALRGARGATAVVTSGLFSVSCWGIDLMTLSCSTTVKHAKCFPPHRAPGVTSLAERSRRCTKWVVHPS